MNRMLEAHGIYRTDPTSLVQQEFHCLGVGVNPDTGGWVAMGYLRTIGQQDTASHVAVVPSADWDDWHLNFAPGSLNPAEATSHTVTCLPGGSKVRVTGRGQVQVTALRIDDTVIASHSVRLVGSDVG